jgi:phage repressor protein C with HTH and peptisase S24 domain
MITLDDAYSWLNKFSNSHIRPSSDFMIGQIKDDLAKGAVVKAVNHLQHLKNLSTKLQDASEVGEVRIICGRMAYKLKNYDDAKAILEDAVTRSWSDLHKRAVVEWMLGCVQWDSAQQLEAVSTWRKSLADFERLTRHAGSSTVKQKWYEETYWKMDRSLIEALGMLEVVNEDSNPAGETEKPKTHKGPKQNEQADPAKKTPAEQVEGNEPTVFEEKTVRLDEDRSTTISNAFRAEEPAVTSTSDILQLFEVSEEIPAGDFGPSGVDPFPIGRIEVDKVTIDGRKYRIYNPHGHKPASLPAGQGVVVVKVKGDSMNQENILPGDFVILRRVDVPANGDIVMAEIIGTDSSATLKKFYVKKDTITLQPHSSNPDHKPFIFKKVGDGFYIRGVVIAILKPV